MARVFNIYITYNNAVHAGMVSVRNTPFFNEYTLRFGDDVMQQLPGNKIISSEPNVFNFLHASDQTSPLIQEIINAVAQHLHAVEIG